MDYLEIYRQHAAEYDRLVNAEDCDNLLAPAIEKIVSLHNATVMEVGAGTGRVSRLMAARDVRVVAVDQAAAMLKIAHHHLGDYGNGLFAQADGRQLPVKSGWADLAIAGWVFGHLRYWLPDNWQQSIGTALDEMQRSLKPNSAMIIIETLGTGSTDPAPPSEYLAEYYHWLETVHGFTRETLRTDYQFASVGEAAEVTGFFFGDEFSAQVQRESWLRVPEYTGLWWKRLT
jgi:ubiquinone/menaquinone biosynthesis C-methylase UbiE